MFEKNTENSILFLNYELCFLFLVPVGIPEFFIIDINTVLTLQTQCLLFHKDRNKSPQCDRQNFLLFHCFIKAVRNLWLRDRASIRDIPLLPDV